MPTLRNRRKLLAVSRENSENTSNIQSQDTLNPGMAEEYITQVSEEIEKKVTKNFFQEFCRTESSILGALSELDEILLDPQVRTCSVAVPGTSRKNNSGNRKPTGYRSLDDLCPKMVFSASHGGNLTDPEQEETHHNHILTKPQQILDSATLNLKLRRQVYDKYRRSPSGLELIKVMHRLKQPNKRLNLFGISFHNTQPRTNHLLSFCVVLY